jgi:hypothetical protein
MSHGLKRYAHRRGGALAGCLIVLGILVVIAIIGVVVVVMNWKSWAASGFRAAAEQAVQEIQLPEEERVEVMAQIDRLATGFKEGDISVERFTEIIQEVAQGPLLPAAAMGIFEAQYIRPSGLSDAEKDAGGMHMSRVAQAFADDQIGADPLADVFDPIQTVSTTGSGVHISHPKFTLHLKAPEECTDDELREVIANAKSTADEAGIAEERMSFDASEAIKQAIDRAMGLTEDSPDAPEPEAP